MPIPVSCTCGRNLRIKEALAGRKIYCPACKAVLLVPAAETAPPTDDLEIIEDEPEDAGYEVVEDDGRTKEGVQTAPRPSRPARGAEDEDDDEEVSQRERVRRREERARERQEEREEEERKERRRKRSSRKRIRELEEQGRFNVRGSRGYFGNTGPGVVGGLIMVVIGIVGVGVGLMLGYICFWPLILVIVGIVAIIKGLSN
jgi:hypothetical protein